MVRDVPTAAEFTEHGIDYLNLGWSSVIDVVLDFADAQEWAGTIDDEMKTGFWAAAERELATALSLTEQGAEFLLKGRICAVSPWLLLSRSPNEWPKRCDKEDVPFSDFRTIDAQDLLKVHDTFAATKLPEDFAVAFEALRRQRNSIMHSINKSLRLATTSLLEQILSVSEYLIGPKAWVRTRRNFVGRDRHSALNCDWDDYRVAREFAALVDLLTKSQLKLFFDFDKGQRAYGCPVCCHASSDVELKCMTAQLRPNTPRSTSVYCFICDTTSPVERVPCAKSGCKGNVRDPEWDECLTCLG